jgi:TolB protein
VGILKLVVLVAAVVGAVCGTPCRAQDRYPVRRLTSHPAQEGFPSWSPDGRTIVYSFGMRGDSAGLTGLWKVPSEGGAARQFTRFIGEHPDWSPDGHYVVFDADEGNAVRLVARRE